MQAKDRDTLLNCIVAHDFSDLSRIGAILLKHENPMALAKVSEESVKRVLLNLLDAVKSEVLRTR